jgi:hypothetical protein
VPEAGRVGQPCSCVWAWATGIRKASPHAIIASDRLDLDIDIDIQRISCSFVSIISVD